MSKMTQQNLRNIKCIFEEKTGTDLNPRHRPQQYSIKRTWVIAAILVFSVLLLAFSSPLFTPLDGDKLTLTGTYLGNGMVSVFVVNDSDKPIRFQERLKLFSWTTQEEVLPLEGDVIFEKNEVAPHSNSTIIIHLSEAYDIEELESIFPGGYYYLLLTNRDFLFGHDWICSFSFHNATSSAESTVESQQSPVSGAAQTIADIEEDLQFYFMEGYWNEIPAFNEANFIYQQKVRELLTHTGGTLVRPVDPMLLVSQAEATVIFDEHHPSDRQHQLIVQNYHALDGYNRIVGTEFSGGGSDYSLQLNAILPQRQGETDGGVSMPLIYLFTYESAAVQSENAYAFIYGQIIPFSQLEKYKVYEDTQYVVYNVTDYFYSDLDAYLDYFLTTREDIFCDDRIRQRVHNIYNYYMNPNNLIFYYNTPQ